MDTAEEVQIDVSEPPDDFEQFEAWRAAGGGLATSDNDQQGSKKPAVGSKQPSEPAEVEVTEEGQIAAESDPADDPEQEETDPEDPPVPGKPNKGLAKRMRELTGEIKALKSQLAGQQPDVEEEATEEVVSSTEQKTDDGATKLVRPKLSNFEDTDDQSAWDQYEAAMEEYTDARTAQMLGKALAEQRQELDTKHAKDTADADWSRSAARYPDFNEVVRDEVRISAAMESVMRMDPETGTMLAYYMGQHPEESERIARASLANNEKEWPGALARAALELGKIAPTLKPPVKGSTKPATPVTPPTPTTKKVTAAKPPPTQLRGTAVTPAVDVMSDKDAGDYNIWEKAREAEIKKR
jgi:hypothetical protein